MARDRSIRLLIQARVDGAKRALGETADAARRVGTEAERASQQTSTAAQRMARSARENSEEWTRVGGVLTAFGAAAGLALAGSAKAAIDWETAWAGVTKTVDGSQAQMAGLNEGLRQMARELPSTHSEIAAVAEAAGQLGIQTDNIESFSRTMLDLGEATNLTADEAATALARFANIMGTSQQEFSNLGSAIVELGNNYATTEREIVEMSTRLAGAGRQAGLTEGEVLGLATALSSVGIEAEAGGTAFSRVLIEMGVAVDTQDSKLRTFAATAGMSAAEFTAAWGDDPGSAISAFVAGLGRMDASGQSVQPILEELGMTDMRVGDALRRSASAADIFTGAMETGNSAYAENVALSEEAAQRYETTAARIDMAKNSVVDAAISLGEVFLPVIVAAADGAADLAGWLADLPRPVQVAVAGMGSLAATAGLAGGAFFLMTPRILESVDAFRTIARTVPGVASSLGAVRGVLGGPWGIALAGGTAALGIFAAQQAHTRAQVDRMRESLDEQTGAITENTLELAASQLNDDGWLRKYKEWGGAVDDLTAAYAGQPDALRRVADFLGQMNQEQLLAGQYSEQHGTEAGRLMGVLEDQSSVMARARDENALLAEATGEAADASQGMLLGFAGLMATMRDFAAEQGVATGAVDGYATAMDRAVAAGDEAAEAYAKMIDEIAGHSAAFVSASGAMDAVQQKSREWAEGQAEAANKANEAAREWAEEQGESIETVTASWEDFYDGQSVAVDDWLSELERQLKAQSEWEVNMLILASRASQGVVDAFAEMGPEGALLLQEFLDGGVEVLERGEAVLGDKGRAGAYAYAEGMANAEVISAAARRWGDDIALGIAQSLERGETTVEQVVDEWDLYTEIQVGANASSYEHDLGVAIGMGNDEVAYPNLDLLTGLFDAELGAAIGRANDEVGTPDLDADPRLADAELSAWLGMADGETGTPDLDADDAPGRRATRDFLYYVDNEDGTVTVYADTSEARKAMNGFFGAYQGTRIGVNLGFGNADGGFHDHGTRYADGGIDAAGQHVPRVPQMGGPQFGKRWITWGEDVTGWEAYISGKPGMEQRNVGIWLEAGRRLPKDMVARALAAQSHEWGMGMLDQLGVPHMHFANGGMSSVLDVRMTEQSRFTDALEGLQREWLQSQGGGVNFGGPYGWNPRGIPWQMLWTMTKQIAPEAVLTSAYRPGAITASGVPSLHGMGRAIDVVSGNMAATFMKMLGAFGSIASQLFYTPMGNLQVGYRDAVIARTHWDHIHLGVEDGGLIEAMSRRPKMADTGVLTLEKGWNPPVWNGLNRLETLVDVEKLYAGTPSRWGGAQAGGTITAALSPADRELLVAAARQPVSVQVGSRQVAYATREGEASIGAPGKWSGAPRLGRG